MMKILVTPTSFGKDKRSRARDQLDAFLAPLNGELVFNPYGRPLNPEELIPLLDEVDGYIAGLDHITAEVMKKAPSSLKVISRYGAGYDRVDVAAAAEKRIVVTNTPGVNAQAVADLAFGLMLSVARRIPSLDGKVRRGEWPRTSGVELYGKTLGIVGLGAVGKGVAARAKGFSMKALAYDPYLDKAYAKENGIRACTFEQILQDSDFISLHIPLNEQTRGILNRESMQRMKFGAIVINTSRGGLIDEAAAYEALKTGKLGGLGLDAFEAEPPGYSPLFELENVVVTPHAGAHTAEAAENMGMLSVQNLIDVLSGKECRYSVNYIG